MCIVKMTDGKHSAWLTFAHETQANHFKTLLIDKVNTSITVYQSNRVPFEDLPRYVQCEAKEWLQFYAEVFVYYDGKGHFSCTSGICVKSQYAADEVVCGHYVQSDLFV